MTWELSLEVAAVHEAAVSSHCQSRGAVALAVVDAGPQARLAADVGFERCRVCGYFPADHDRDATETDLRLLLASLGLAGDHPLTWRFIEERDWLEEWKAGQKPLAVGRRLLIVPTWVSDPGEQERNGRLIIRMDPEMAFGSGSHETTRGCLEALEARAAAPGGLGRVLDLGTGSGILSIGAALLGAAAGLATDNDPVAVAVCRANLARNLPGRPDAVQVLETAAIPDGPFDTVVANILAPVLLSMLGRPGGGPWGGGNTLDRVLVPGGTLILSGILQGQQVAELIDACRRTGWGDIAFRPLGDWAVVTAQRPPA
ncbi:MAG: 50S ribosomal protein L11 methyltransferase [Magnetococcales bacterium]|nr:50S ribosomal protein L11 methyltransferase [Magnetococcales bacterium]